MAERESKMWKNLEVMESKSFWLLVLLYRILISLFLIQTSDVPDEWWQSTEVAYAYIFGKGELTWEWRSGIRSFFYPLPFAGIFYVLKVMGLDTAELLFALPKILSAIICFGIDVSVYRYTKAIFGKQVAVTAAGLTIFNWFISFVGVRTQSNAAEALIFLIALISLNSGTNNKKNEEEEEISFCSGDSAGNSSENNDLTKRKKGGIFFFFSSSYFWFLFWCGFGCALRITFSVLCVPWAMHYWYSHHLCPIWNNYNEARKGSADDEKKSPSTAKKESLMKAGSKQQGHQQQQTSQRIDGNGRHRDWVPTAVAAAIADAILTVAMIFFWFAVIAIVDYQFYGRWLCTPLAFVSFNVIEGLSSLFGTHPWHWYVSSGIPPMVGTEGLLLLLFPLTILRQALFPWPGSGGMATPTHDDLSSKKELCTEKKGEKKDDVESSSSSCTKTMKRCDSVLLAHHQLIALRLLLSTIFFTTLCYSFLPHKEFRFVFPLLPLLLLLCSIAWVHSFNDSFSFSSSLSWREAIARCCRQRRHAIAVFMILTNLGGLFVFGYTWQRGMLDAFAFIRQNGPLTTTTKSSQSSGSDSGEVEGVLYTTSDNAEGVVTISNFFTAAVASPPRFHSLHVLAGCHQTPGYSYIHNRVEQLDMINCTVQMDTMTHRRVPTEDLMFMTDPLAFVMYVYDGELIPSFRFRTLGRNHKAEGEPSLLPSSTKKREEKNRDHGAGEDLEKLRDDDDVLKKKENVKSDNDDDNGRGDDLLSTEIEIDPTPPSDFNLPCFPLLDDFPSIQHMLRCHAPPPKSKPLPQLILIYRKHAVKIQLFLQRHRYVKRKSWYHTFHPLEESIGTWCELWERKTW